MPKRIEREWKGKVLTIGNVPVGGLVDCGYSRVSKLDSRGKRGFQPERLAQGLEVGSIRRIQGIGYGVLEFLGVGTTFDIFQNIQYYIFNTAYVFFGYGGSVLLSLCGLLVKCRHGYSRIFLDSSAYWS
ncbi:hypothetical protein Tco_0903921 [Tanacetum coccineum]